jgi:autotransporter-associated beta strand protein
MFNQLQHLGRGIPARAAAVVLACAVGAPAQAATYWWNTGNALWTANGSWAANADGSGAGSVPTSADTAVFSVTGSTAAVTGTLGIDAAVYGIRTLPGQLGLTLTAASARTLTIGAGGIESQGSLFVSGVNGRIALADSQAWSGDFRALAGNVSLASSSSETLLYNQLGLTGTVTGIWSDGSGGGKLSVWVTGTGSTRFNTTPTFTGTLTLQEGRYDNRSSIANIGKIQLAGGRLVGNSSATSGAIDVIGGSSSIESAWFLNSQAFTRVKGGGVVSRPSTAGLGSADMVNGIIPWMATGNTDTPRFASVVSGTIVAVSGSSLGSGQQFNLNNVTGTTGNYVFGNVVTGSSVIGSVTLSANRTVNSLNYLGDGTVDLAGFDLTLNAALVNTALATTAFTAQGSGRIMIGDSGELVFRGWNNSVVISSTIGETAAGGHLAIGSTVINTTYSAPTGSFTLSGNNVHSGGTSLHGLRLNIDNAGALGTGTFTLSGGTLDNTSGAAIVNANNNAQVWNVDLAFAGSNPLNLGTGAVSLGGWAGRTRTVTVTSSTLTVGGGIADGTHADLATIGLDKAGAGTLVLGGVNTYTGPTAVSAGSLLFNGRSTGGGAFSVAAAATLGGSGTIGGAVSVSGTLAPGDGTGVLTVGSVNLGSTSTTLLQISGTSRGSLYDAITATGGAGIGYGGALALVLTGTNYSGTFDLFNFASLASTGSFTSISATGDFGSFSFTPTASGTWTSAASGSRPEMTFSQTTGDLVIVPEPAAIVIAGLGGLLLAWRLRRRRAAD